MVTCVKVICNLLTKANVCMDVYEYEDMCEMKEYVSVLLNGTWITSYASGEKII